MKKLTFILAATALVLSAHTVNAQVLQSSGSDTTNTSGSGGSVINGQIPCSPACSATQTCNSFGVCVDNTPLQSAGNPSVESSQTSSGSNTQTSGFVPLAPIPNLTDNVDTSNGLAGFLNQLYKYLIGLAAVIAVIEIVIGGLEYATQDSVSKKSDGQHRITQAVLGLVLVLSPALVFSIINPSILNLSLNLQNLNTAPNTGSSGGNTSPENPQGTTDTSTGCTVSGTSGFLQKAVCPSDSAASAWANQNCTTGQLINAGCGGSNSSGCTQSIRYCKYNTGNLVLIDISPSKINYLFAPLAAQPQTVTTFQSFLPGCANSGGNVCAVSSVGPGLWISHDCANYGGYQTTIPGTTNTSRCYEKTLACDPPNNSTGDYCGSGLNFSSTPFQ